MEPRVLPGRLRGTLLVVGGLVQVWEAMLRWAARRRQSRLCWCFMTRPTGAHAGGHMLIFRSVFIKI